LIGDIKTGSTNHINEQRWIRCRFSWQEGYGAFSVSHSHLDRVADYIRNQETHHRQKSFHEEYVEFLERHHVPYDQRYPFKADRLMLDGEHVAPMELQTRFHTETRNVALLTELCCGEGMRRKIRCAATRCKRRTRETSIAYDAPIH
jgi:hypothetical protein